MKEHDGFFVGSSGVGTKYDMNNFQVSEKIIHLEYSEFESVHYVGLQLGEIDEIFPESRQNYTRDKEIATIINPIIKTPNIHYDLNSIRVGYVKHSLFLVFPSPLCFPRAYALLNTQT